ncbi:Hypothetical predicted protein [Cloeon dipterum]|uniref:CRAL-TRIO domain-containing protein n=1 Tax=Cloeon dipterum TaxID=197152 RepID=A0A8S1D4Y1_9INSE|nr:Hypothetical predicted protein [Cloeon dipterum]
MEDDVGTLKIRPLSPELLEYAIKKLNEDPKRREADVKAIREWLKKQTHIIADPSDQLIVSFLRGCKWSLEKTKVKLDMFYTMRTMAPELFKNRDLNKDAKLREIIENTYFFPTGHDFEGRKVYMMVIGKDDPEGKIKMEDVIRMNFVMMDYMVMHDDETIVKGIVQVGDLAMMKMAYATQMMPSFMKKINVCFEEGYPFRPQAMHMINMPSFFEKVMKFFQSFQKEKITRRQAVYGSNWEKMYETVPKKIMPNEYGGEAGTIDSLSKKFAKELLEFNDWLIADEKNGVDEKKRIGRAKTKEDLFGMEGSFRQLEFD